MPDQGSVSLAAGLPSGRRPALRALRDELAALVSEVSPSVVTVRSVDSQLTVSSGSGWIYAPGLVVTNAHVVLGPDAHVQLRLHGGARVPAHLVGADRATDLAVLRTVGSTPALPLRGTPVPLGELCLAFGSPLGELTESVTLGVVSGLQRRLPFENGRSIEEVLQTDAEINPGNSGGPLVDVDGCVIGVNTAIRVDGRGVGFAIPAQTVASIVPELVAHGAILRPTLGVTIDVVERDTPEHGVDRERLRIASAPHGSPFQPGDILVSIGGQAITSRGDLFRTLRRPLVGTVTRIEVQRGQRTIAVEVPLVAEADSLPRPGDSLPPLR